MTPPKNHLKIGIFDSGFGGLTVMRAIRELLPQENIAYFGDTARLPYGSKSTETIAQYSLENSSFLLEQGIKILVVACHTACSAALPILRAKLNIPIIGITEQGVDELVRTTKTGRIAVLGTRATIASGIYQQQIAQRLPQSKLTSISCPLFVPLVEEGYIEHPMTTLAVREYLAPIHQEGIDTLLLGCTHYPLLQALIQQELKTGISLIDPAIACAQKTKETLQSLSLINTQTELPHYEFFVTDDPEKFRSLGLHFLQYPITTIYKKSL